MHVTAVAPALKLERLETMSGKQISGIIRCHDCSKNGQLNGTAAGLQVSVAPPPNRSQLHESRPRTKLSRVGTPKPKTPP